MSDAKSQQEPSMEEILASIRRIISEDGTEEREEGAPDAPPGENQTGLDAARDGSGPGGAAPEESDPMQIHNRSRYKVRQEPPQQ